jgi:DNA-binding NarL/FixJ family response regulator
MSRQPNPRSLRLKALGVGLRVLGPGSSWSSPARQARIRACQPCLAAPAAQRERDRLQARRLRTAELLAAGVHQAEVARQLGISAQAVSVWHARFQQGGAGRDN